MRRTIWIVLMLVLALGIPQAAAAESPPTEVLTLGQALNLAERYNPGLQLARYQMNAARGAIVTAPANAANLAPAAAMYAQVQLGLTIPENAISPAVARRQAQITYEQAVADYYSARQQVRLGAVQAYVEWQRATALVAAQQGALERAKTQEAHVQAALDLGSVARYDLLQVQAQVAGQQAALTGAEALLFGARHGLEQAIGRRLSPAVQPEPMPEAATTSLLQTDENVLMAQALVRRPDVRQAALDVAARRLQTGLATGGGAAGMQVQAATTQYELLAVKARAEVQQALLTAKARLAELKARETALGPAREALRLAELRYEAGLATYLEVQSASAATLQAEAARIQAAADLTIALSRLAQAAGDL